MKRNNPGALGYFLRLLSALLLVFATFNPSGWSFYHWAAADINQFGAIHALGAMVLVVGWAMFVRATIQSLGVTGTVLATAFFGAMVWVIIDFGWLRLDNATAMTWATEAILA